MTWKNYLLICVIYIAYTPYVYIHTAHTDVIHIPVHMLNNIIIWALPASAMIL